MRLRVLKHSGSKPEDVAIEPVPFGDGPITESPRGLTPVSKRFRDAGKRGRVEKERSGTLRPMRSEGGIMKRDPR